MDPSTFSLEARGIAVSLDLSVGHIAMLRVRTGDGAGDRVIEPLHRAPWIGEREDAFPDGTPPNVRRLSGDFFCAPFGRNDVEPAPSHGWPANSSWSVLGEQRGAGCVSATFVLDRTVQGCRITKRLRLVDGHPFLYQEHVLEGGEGLLSVSHHVMTRAAGGARLAFSAKSRAWTMETALEPDPLRGRFALAYPADTSVLDAFPRADGSHADLRTFPVATAGEEFVVLDEADDTVGWTIVNRHAESDALVVLKPSAVLPRTMLWMSHRGRDYAPWNGRHDRVLGIEDARATLAAIVRHGGRGGDRVSAFGRAQDRHPPCDRRDAGEHRHDRLRRRFCRGRQTDPPRCRRSSAAFPSTPVSSDAGDRRSGGDAAPDRLRGPHDEIELPLLVVERDLVALFCRGEAALRRDAELVEIDMAGCCIELALQRIERLEIAGLGGDESRHDALLALREEPERLEPAGALRVILHEEDVDARLVEDGVRGRVVGTFRDPGRPGSFRGTYAWRWSCPQAGRRSRRASSSRRPRSASRDRALRLLLGADLRVTQIGEKDVVHLEIAAAGVVERLHRLGIGPGEIGEENVEILILFGWMSAFAVRK